MSGSRPAQTTPPGQLNRRMQFGAWAAPALTLRWLPALFISLSLVRSLGDDPRVASFGWAPLIFAGFAEVKHFVHKRGGRRESIAARVGHRLGLGSLLAGAILQARFPHPYGAKALTVLFALVVLHRAATLMLAARPLLGSRLPARLSPAFFLLPLLTYLAFIPWTLSERLPNGDEPFYLLITHSLAYDFDTKLTNNYENQDWNRFTNRALKPQEDDPVGPDGELYSRHNFVLPLALAPAYRVAGRPGTLVIMALLTALLAWSTLRLARHYFPDRPGESLLAYSLFALAPPTLIYATQIWVEVPAALLTVVLLDLVLSMGSAPRRAQWLGLLSGLGGLLLLKLRFGLIALPLVVLLARNTARKTMLLAGAALAGLGGLLLAINRLLYGNWLKIHRWAEILELHENPPTAFVNGLTGIFFDCAFGLFACAPIWFLLLVVSPTHKVDRRLWRRHLGILFGLYLLVLIPRTEWFGGFSPPFRYGYLLLPLLSLGMIPVLVERHRGGCRLLLSALLTVTVVLALCWIVVPGWGYNLAHGRNHLLDHMSLRWDRDFARFFPSLVRPRLATWLWPLLSLPLINLIYRSRWPRSSGARALGLGLVLAVALTLPVAARYAPQATLEMEDPMVQTGGGALYPALWTPHRIRYQGGRLLQPGAWLKASTQAQAPDRLDVHLNFLTETPEAYTLSVWNGEELVGTFTGREQKEWDVATFPLASWTNEQPLWITLDGPKSERRRVVIVDRVAFSRR